MTRQQTAEQQTIELFWLGERRPAIPAGITWGVPWPIGELKRDTPLVLTDTHGRNVPVQSWVTAYWPDGSVKWTAHAVSLNEAEESYFIGRGDEKSRLNHDSPLTVATHDAYIEVDTGAVICQVNRSGSSLIRGIYRAGRPICTDGRLIGVREQDAYLHGKRQITEDPFEGEIEEAVVEQAGPVRAVVKLRGRHRMKDGRKWLPFTVRLYFYAGQVYFRMVHTFIYDGNPHQDFISGLGIRFGVPLSGPLYNRHVRLAGDTGWFSESPKGLMLFRLQERQRKLYAQQTAGRFISFDPEQDRELLALLSDSPEWGGFRLSQLSCDSYTISKRTKEGCAWIRAAMGARSRGVIYAGSETGGLAVGVRDFWEKYPSGLEVDGMTGEAAELTVWLWSLEAPAMDLRHYDTETHVESCYEGAAELRSTPYGIGNTHELYIWCCTETPDAELLDAMAAEKDAPSLLICAPERYYRTRALGFWSLPDRSTPMKARIEDALEELIRFYQEEIEQRRWYGFWDYGDVMHSYDPVRHTWKYDIGGCAWQNTELVPNMWLWYSFLRTGRADIFRMAEAMTRHTSEVDLYHIGEYAGLGSRHNVLHWGCGCKEARIGMAGLHRFYYYLTADERIGDIMHEVKDADFTTLHLDPMRAYYAKDEFPTHTRSGPDWAAFCSNWLVQWERFEDLACRDKMLRGLEDLKRMPDRLLTGPVFGYDPKTGELMYMSDENYGHHLMICMGGAQVWLEMAYLLQDPEWEQMLVEYGEFYTLPKEEKARRTKGRIQGIDWNIPMLATTMMAFAARYKQDERLAKEAWHYLLHSRHWSVGMPLKAEPVPRSEYVREIREIPWISTNTASQWSINVMFCLEWIAEHLPESPESLDSLKS